MTPLRLALLNLSRRKLPTVITIFSIAISIACGGILLRLNEASQARFSTLGRGGEALVGAKAGGIEILLGALNGEGVFPGFLPYKLFQTLRAEQSVKFEDGAQAKPTFLRSIIPMVYFAKFKNYRIVGTDESFLKRPVEEDSLTVAEGQWVTSPGEVVLGSALANHENLHVGDVLLASPWLGEGRTGLSTGFTLKITGVLASTGSSWDRMAYTNLGTAHRVLATQDLHDLSIWGPEVLNYFLVYLQPGTFDQLSALVNRRTVAQAILVADEKERLENLTGAGTKIGLFMTILVLTLSGLSVTSMLVTRFEGMSLQLAVLRAIGYKRKQIGQWLLWEGFLLGIMACVLGIILDLLGFPLMRSLLGEALPSEEIVHISILQSFPIWLTGIFATVASVFLPLYRVYRQDVHFSLRN